MENYNNNIYRYRITYVDNNGETCVDYRDIPHDTEQEQKEYNAEFKKRYTNKGYVVTNFTVKPLGNM